MEVVCPHTPFLEYNGGILPLSIVEVVCAILGYSGGSLRDLTNTSHAVDDPLLSS